MKSSPIVITANKFRVAQSSETPEGTDDGWLVVAEDEHTFDLLKVVGQEESLGISELAPGTYNQASMDIVSVVITRGGEQVEHSGRCFVGSGRGQLPRQ